MTPTQRWAEEMLSAWINPTPESVAFRSLKWIGAFVGSVYVGWPEATQWLFKLACIDYVAGMMVATKQGGFSWSRGFWGIVKKFALFVLVDLAYDVGMHSNLPGLSEGFGKTVALGFAFNEFYSIVFNCIKLDVWMPKILIDALLRLRGRSADLPEKRPDDVSDTVERGG